MNHNARAQLRERPLPINPSGLERRLLRWMRLVWRDRALAIVLSAAIAAASGLIVAAAMPRGPITSAQALWLLATGLAVGVVTGLTMRSRRAMLLVPAVNVLAFELGRRGTDGPTVDGLHVDTTFGILAIILSRGFYVLVGLVPMALGVVYGAALARRLTPPSMKTRRRRVGFYLRRAGGTLSTVGVIALAVLIARPASTPAIAGPDGKPLAGSVAELTKVRLGGHDQWILVRGRSVDNPVLLWLDGGPGQSGLAFTRALFGDLEQDFVVVDWDQRGAGKSYPALDPTSTWTLDRAVADTIELTNYLRQRFGEDRIYLGGESWGTTLGVLAVQQRPDLYHAYLGSGQMVSQRETDRLIYRDLLAYAERTGDDGLANKLRGYGEPPYADVWAYGYVMEHYELIETDYDPPAYYDERGEESRIGPWGLTASEYNLVEKVSVLRGLIDSFAVMYPQLQEIDFRRDVPRLEIPVYIFDGAHELSARRDLALEWYGQLQAPIKRIYSFDAAGHAPAREEFREFRRVLVETVVPETYLRA
jgi:proline iminopeptidase